jgi:hypothetical protein
MPYKRRFRKKGNFAKAVKKVVRKMSETKCQYTPLSVANSTSSNGSATDVVRISESVSGNGRIGSTVQLRHIKIKGVVEHKGTTVNTPVRVMLFYSATENASSINVTNYLTGSYDPKRYFPLMDKYVSPRTYNLASAETPQGPMLVSFSKKINYYQKYTGGTSSELGRGNLILVISQSNDANTQTEFSGRMECWYDDI